MIMIVFGKPREVFCSTFEIHGEKMKKKIKSATQVAESSCQIVESLALEALRAAKADHKPVAFVVIIGDSENKTFINNLFFSEFKIVGPITKASQKKLYFEACGLRRCLSGSVCTVTGKGSGTLQVW